jgi:serine/threonine protein phosphatase PrpC
MGVYLAKPDLTRHSDAEDLVSLKYAYSSVQGWRIKQEDLVLVKHNFDKSNSLFAIIESHGSTYIFNNPQGQAIATYIHQNLVSTLLQN